MKLECTFGVTCSFREFFYANTVGTTEERAARRNTVLICVK
jgi:hypothetical protein